MFTALFFWFFAAMTLTAAAMVVAARNPVHAVLFLILAFFSSAGLFILLGAEFIAMLMVVVYVGAVAVLLLFVVMMLDVDFESLRGGNKPMRRILAAGLGLVLLAELALILGGEENTTGVAALPLGGRSNIERIGDILYTDYIFVFQTAGVILLVAMVGAITLTMRTREGVKRQDIMAQTTRRRDEALAVVSVPSRMPPAPIAMTGEGPDADAGRLPATGAGGVKRGRGDYKPPRRSGGKKGGRK